MAAKTKSAGRARPRKFGRIEQRASGKYRVGFVGPDAQLHRAPHHYANRGTAEAWLADEEALIAASERDGFRSWVSPESRREAHEREQAGLSDIPALAAFATDVLNGRRVRGAPLKPRTRSEYDRLLARYIVPVFGDSRLDTITRADLRTWLDGDTFKRDIAAVGGARSSSMSTTRARAYDLLRGIMREAVNAGYIAASPATLKGAGEAHRDRTPQALTLTQVAALAEAMPPHLSLAVLLSARCGLRQGEMFALERRDIDGADGDTPMLHVRRNVTRVKGSIVAGSTKTVAGERTVPIPRSVAPALRAHLTDRVGPEPDAVVFPAPRGRYMAPSSLYGRAGTDEAPGYGFYEARRIAALETLTWHDLRH